MGNLVSNVKKDSSSFNIFDEEAKQNCDEEKPHVTNSQIWKEKFDETEGEPFATRDIARIWKSKTNNEVFDSPVLSPKEDFTSGKEKESISVKLSLSKLTKSDCKENKFPEISSFNSCENEALASGLVKIKFEHQNNEEYEKEVKDNASNVEINKGAKVSPDEVIIKKGTVVTKYEVSDGEISEGYPEEVI